jgi:citrate synthase
MSGRFALGRTAGWIAHAIEQYESDQVIRPRPRTPERIAKDLTSVAALCLKLETAETAETAETP